MRSASDSNDAKSWRPLFGIRLWLLIITILAIGVGLSFAAYRYGVDWEHSKLDASFRLAAATMGERLEREMQANQDVVLALRAFFDSSEKVTFEDFKVFTRDLLMRHQDIRALEWIPRVDGFQRSAFEAEASNLIGSKFHITERSADGKLINAGQREEYFPVYYLEPLAGNRAALGFDLASSPTRLKALNQSVQSGTGVASGRIKLVQENESGYGFLYFMPVFAGQTIPVSEDLRQSQLRGFALGVFHVPKLVSTAIPYYQDAGIDLFLFDVTEKNSQAGFLFGRCPAAPSKHEPTHIECIKKASISGHVYLKGFDFGGRKWQVVLAANPKFLEGGLTYLPHTILAAGLLATLLSLFMVLNSARAGKELYEKNLALSGEVAERIRAESQLAMFKNTVSQMRDAAYLSDSEGRFFYVNDSACAASGYSKDELLAMSVPDIDPDFPREIWPQHWRELQQSKHLFLESRHRRKNGEAFPVELSLNYVEFEGEAYNCAFARDITQRKEAEQALKRELNLNASLAKLGVAMAGTSDIEHLALLFLEEAKSLTGSEHGFVADIEPINQKAICYNLPEAMTMECQVEGAGGIMTFCCDEDGTFPSLSGHCLNTREPFYTNTPMDHPSYGQTAPQGHVHLNGFLAAPAISGGELLGQIALANPAKHYTDKELSVVDRLAHLWAIAVERYRAREESVKEKEKAQQYLDLVGAVLVAINEEQEITLINRAGCHLLGYEEGEILGGNWFDTCIPADDRDRLKKLFAQILAGEVEPAEFYENEIMTKSGERRLMAWHNTFFRDDSGNIMGSLSSGEDITERRRAEVALRGSEEKYRLLFDQSESLISVYDRQGNCLMMNQRVADLFNGSPEDFIGKNFSELHPEKAQEYTAGMTEVIDAEEQRIHEDIVKFPTGERYLLSTTHPVRDANGKVYAAQIMSQDITERKQAEDALRASEEKYRLIFDQSESLISVYDPQGTCLMMNARVAGLFGGSAEDFVGKNFSDLHPAVAQEYTARIAEVIKTEELRTYEDVVEFPEGERVLLSTVHPVRDAKGNVYAAQIMSQDITERKQAEDALRASEELLREAQHIAHIAHWTFDPATGMPWWSEELYRIYGRDPADGPLPYAEHPKLVHPDDWEWFDATVRDTAESGTPFDIILRIMRPDGSERIINSICQPIIDDTGTVVEMRGTIQDVTNLKQAETELRESEEKYRLLVQSMNDGLGVTEADGTMTFVNQRLCEIVGYSEEEMIGRKVTDFLDEENKKEFIEQRAHRKEGGSETYELVISGKGGRRINSLISPTPIFDDKGQFQGSIAVVTDVTELKRAEEALQEHQRRLATLMSNLPGMAYHCKNKEDWPLDFASQGCRELTGYSPAELTSSESPHYGDLIHPDDRHSVWDAVQHSLQTGEPFILEYRIRDKQGRERWVWEHGMVVGQDTDGIDILEGFIYDVTQRKLADDAIKESENRFRSITEHAVDYIFIKDKARKYAFVNQATQKLFGLAQPEIIGKTADDFFGPEQGRLIKEIDDRAFSGETVNETAALIINGETLYFNTIQTPLTWKNGEVATIMGVVRDITEIKHAEKALRKNEELLSKQLVEINHIYQTSPIGLAFLDANLRFVRINQTMAEINGAAVEAHLGKTLHDVLPDLAPSLEPLYRGVIQSGEALTNQAINGTTPADPDDERDWLVNYYPIKTPEGLIMGVGTVVQDITELKQAERALEKLNEELEERVEQRTAALEAANRELESFAYSVSHDLRAPLRALDGFSQAVLEDYREQIDDEGQDYLRRIRAASQRMGQLIDDILRLSRLSRAEMKPRDVSLSLVASDIAGRLQKEEPEREARLSIQPDVTAWGDENLLRVLMENLLGNAWKFTSTQPTTSIEFGAIKQADESEAKARSGQVYFVKDNGVGFNPDYKDKVFQVFQRLHTDEEFPGTGIGLATVQRIINRHGGKVWTEAEEGKGATFYFTLGGRKT